MKLPAELETRYVVFREDDVNYFTPPELLAQLYEPLLSRGLPVSFAAIPVVDADTRIAYGERSKFYRDYGRRFEPFIPPAVAGQPRRFDISENDTLVRFIRGTSGEVIQHGFTHRWYGRGEFDRNDRAALEFELMDGQKQIEAAFGRRAEVFCPPWDTTSRAGLDVVRAAGFRAVALGRWIGPALLPGLIRDWARPRGAATTWNGLTVFRHPGSLLSVFRRPDEVFARFHQALRCTRVLVLVNHHWEYALTGGVEPDRERLELLHLIQRFVLDDPHTQVTTFGALQAQQHSSHGSQSPWSLSFSPPSG